MKGGRSDKRKIVEAIGISIIGAKVGGKVRAIGEAIGLISGLFALVSVNTMSNPLVISFKSVVFSFLLQFKNQLGFLL